MKWTCLALALEDRYEHLSHAQDVVWGIRDQLYKHVPNNDLKDLLESNDQAIPSGESKVCIMLLISNSFKRIPSSIIMSKGP